MPKIARYGTQKLTKVVVPEKNNADMSNASKIIEKSKKQKKMHFAESLEVNIFCLLTSSIASFTFKRQIVKALKSNKLQTNQTPQAAQSNISTTTNSEIKTGLQYEEIYMKILQKRRINLLFENRVKISPNFAKFLCGIIT